MLRFSVIGLDCSRQSISSSDSNFSSEASPVNQSPIKLTKLKWTLPPAHPLLSRSMFDNEPVRLGAKDAFM